MSFILETPVGTTSNYKRHFSLSLFNASADDSSAVVAWPDADMRRTMRGLVLDFSKQYRFMLKSMYLRDEP